MPSTEDKVRALYDFWFFIEMCKFKGGVRNFDPVHHELALFLSSPQLPEDKLKFPREHYLKRFIMMHRGGFKSTMVVLYVLWRIYRNPNIRVLYNGCSKDLTQSFLKEISQYFLDGRLQKEVWNSRPHIPGVLVPKIAAEDRRGRMYDKDEVAQIVALKVEWNMQRIQVIRTEILKEPTIDTTSVKVSDTGQHVDLVINDDLVTFDNSDRPDKARKIFTKAADTVNVLDPPRESHICDGFSEVLGREVITTGTPYYKWDYNVSLRENHEKLGYIYFERSIYVDGKKGSGYTCPSRFNDKVCEEMKAEIVQARGLKAWLAQMELKIIDDENAVLRSDKVTRIPASAVKLAGNSLVDVKIEGETYEVRIQGALDPASSESASANHSALVIGGYLPDGDFVIIGGFKKKLTAFKLVKECYKWWNNFNVGKATIETPPSTGNTYVELFNRFRPDRARTIIHGVKPVINKNARMEATLEPFLGEASLNRIYCVDTIYDELTEEVDSLDLTNEINDDDLLDALEQLISATPVRYQKRKPKNYMEDYAGINKHFGGFYS